MACTYKQSRELAAAHLSLTELVILEYVQNYSFWRHCLIRNFVGTLFKKTGFWKQKIPWKSMKKTNPKMLKKIRKLMTIYILLVWNVWKALQILSLKVDFFFFFGKSYYWFWKLSLLFTFKWNRKIMWVRTKIFKNGTSKKSTWLSASFLDDKLNMKDNATEMLKNNWL